MSKLTGTRALKGYFTAVRKRRETRGSSVGPAVLLGYGFADFGQLAVLQFVTIYLMYFYTDVLGVAAGTVGTIFLLSRLWDAVNDPMMGFMIDRTRTKYGKCRPYLLGGSALFGLSSVALFLVPGLNGFELTLFVIVTYNLFNMAFTATNIPFTALLPLITPDAGARVQLSASRAFFEAMAFASVPLIADNLISMSGGRHDPQAYMVVASVFAIICFVAFALTFFLTEENSADRTKTVRMDQLLPLFYGNWPWLIIVSVNALVNVAVTMRAGSAIYFFEYVLGDMTHFGTFMMLGFVALFPFGLLAPWLAHKLGKRGVVLLGCVLGLLGNLVLILFPTSVTGLFLGSFLSGCALGGLVSVLFAIIGDISDEAQRRHGVRAHGVISSAIALGYKLGLGFGAAGAGWILALGDYTPEAEIQTDVALQVIFISFAWMPMFILAMCIPILLFYKLESKQ